MPRAHVEFVHVYDATARGVSDGLFEGSRWRTLSEDETTGAETALVTFPADWEADLVQAIRPLEILVLKGTGSLGEYRLGPGTWAWIPPQIAVRWRFDSQADVLLMKEEERGDAGQLEVIDTEGARFTGPTTAVPPGL